MVDVEKLIEMYQDDYSLTYLSDYFGYDRRTIKRILEDNCVKIRRTKRASRKSYLRREAKDRINRVREIGYIKEKRGKAPNGPVVNESREWILVNVARGIDSLKSLFNKKDCPYSSRSSLSFTLREMRDSGLIVYESSWRGILNISITEWGEKRIFEPSLANEIKRINKLYPHLDYQELAIMVGCDRTYPRIVLSE